MLMDRQTDKKWTNEWTELHQFRKESSYDAEMLPAFDERGGIPPLVEKKGGI